MTETRVIRTTFPDESTGRFFTKKWVETAKLLGLAFDYDCFSFGEGKFFAKFILEGTKTDMQRFIKFTEDSSSLIEELEH